MPRQASKRPRPSYEQGGVRDPKIVTKQDPNYSKADFERAVRKAATERAHDDAERS